MAQNKSSAPDKVSPAKYIAQVRQEGRKVVWPGWRETYTTTILVMIMVILMGIFFFFTDYVILSLIHI